MFEKYQYNEMESLRFVMYASPDTRKYWFKSYPWFVNESYMSKDMTNEDSVINKVLIDQHKQLVYYGTAIRKELFDTLEDIWPHVFFEKLDEALISWYNEFKQLRQKWKLYSIWFHKYTPKEEILKIRNDVFGHMIHDIQLLECGMITKIHKIAHSVSQALLYRQKYFLEDL